MTYSQGFWTAAIMTLLLIPLNATIACCYAECFDTSFLANWSAAEGTKMGTHNLLHHYKQGVEHENVDGLDDPFEVSTARQLGYES